MKSTLRLLALAIAMICNIVTINAQIENPISWTSNFEIESDSVAIASFNADIATGWHLYATKLPEGGPVATRITWDMLDGVETVGELTSNVAPHTQVDSLFQLELAWWVSNVTLTQSFKITDINDIRIEGEINFMACNDKSCLPPNKYAFSFTPTTQAPLNENSAEIASPSGNNSARSTYDTWLPIKQTESGDKTATSSLWYIFIGGLIGGLLALLTPCVWPMIPLTVSFFLKKSSSRVGSLAKALGYGISIVIIYLALGLTISLLFGASKLNDLSTNAIFNIIFFVLLIVFAASFLGAFNIELPSSWSTKINNNASKATGWISIFFMAFTLTLVSFSCTGPIIGTLLVEAATIGNITGPAVGMFGFALALAIPFSLFAIFPTWLNGIPKSGGWLNSVKVVLGFIELALSLKFLSVADLAYGWRLLDREVFIALWIVIFVLLGMYLLGKIQFPHDTKVTNIGITRFFMALVSLSFAVYLIPGLWGAPLKAISAFAPPLHTQDFNLYDGAKFHEFDNYDEGLRFASEHNLPAFIDFSGHGCVNCRKMEVAVFDNDDVREILEKNFVMVKLMVDDKHPLPSPYIVEENGKQIKIKTIGEKWSYLQRYKFGANSQPYYMVVNGKGEYVAGPYYYDENINEFINFLNQAIENFSSKK